MADDAEWMSGKSRNRLVPVLTEASSWISGRRLLYWCRSDTENSCHWSLDMTFREDESLLRERQSREDVAWLNRSAFSPLKQRPGRQSLVMRRPNCGWSDAFAINYIDK
jgi:hypothetical protein